MTRIHGGLRQVQRVRPVRLLKWKRFADVDGLEFERLVVWEWSASETAQPVLAQVVPDAVHLQL